MKSPVILIALLGGCAHTAPALEPGGVPDRGDIVVSGELPDGSELRLAAASGRVFAVRAQRGRYAVVLPAGVYDVKSIDGVRPAVPLTFNAIPGDRVELTRAASTSMAASGATSLGATTPETPFSYHARTGALVRPLPVPANWGGGSRVGMGLGLRSR